jgi:hypothetical protein
MTIKFYRTKGEHGWGSNFYRAPISLDGAEWPTSEHYYQAQKATTYEDRERIRNAPNPKEAAKMGRTLSSIRGDWEQVKYGVMKKAVRAKFLQNVALMRKLLETGTEEIVEWTEGTPLADSIWGNAPDKNGNPGQNLLGKCLMEIREEFRKEIDNVGELYI